MPVRILFRKFQRYLGHTQITGMGELESYLESFKVERATSNWRSSTQLESYLESFKVK